MRLESDNDFEVLDYSDSRYENLTVEIQYRGEPIAQINKEKGLQNLELEIFANPSDSILKVPLSGFLGALILAKGLIE